MMSLWDALRMNMMISYQELVRTFLNANKNTATGYERGNLRRIIDGLNLPIQVGQLPRQPAFRPSRPEQNGQLAAAFGGLHPDLTHAGQGDREQHTDRAQQPSPNQ